MTPRAGVYLRVSTDRQTVENQRAALARLVEARGWAPVWYVDESESGARTDRPELARLRGAVHRGELVAVVCWALDRLGRSMVHTVSLVLELDARGVKVVSLREPWLDVAGPVRDLLLAIFGWVAEQERARIAERTRAGMERARRAGIPIGRPRTSPVALAQGVALARGGAPIETAARRAGVSPRTLARVLRPGKRVPSGDPLAAP
jgi:putative DNA-invertase from lambdoid prophage Rac